MKWSSLCFTFMHPNLFIAVSVDLHLTVKRHFLGVFVGLYHDCRNFVIYVQKMNESRRKPTTFMIADLLRDVSCAEATSSLSPEVNISGLVTGSDVVVNNSVDYSTESPPGGGIHNDHDHLEHGLFRRFSKEDRCCDCTLSVATPRGSLYSAAETFPPVVKPLLQRRESSSGCFQNSGDFPPGVNQGHDLASCLSLEQAAAAAGRHCVMPLQWHAVIQRAVRTAGQHNILRP